MSFHYFGVYKHATAGLIKKSSYSWTNQKVQLLAEEDWHMPIESFQYFIILFRVNQVFTFYHFIVAGLFITYKKSPATAGLNLIKNSSVAGIIKRSSVAGLIKKSSVAGLFISI